MLQNVLGSPDEAKYSAMLENKGRYARPARTHLPTGRGWPRLEAALGLLWRWRGVLKGEVAEAGCVSHRYRRVRLANAKVDAALRPQPAARRLLELCGFVASADGEHLDMADAAARDGVRLQFARGIIKGAREAVEID